MKKSGFIWFALFIFVGAFLSGCTDSAPSGPTPGLGSVSVTKYVAIGNSLTAGYQSNGLYASAQIYSYPKMISQQLVKAGAVLDTFQQPLYGDPGNADPGPGPNTGKSQRYVILNFTDPKNPVIGPEGKAAGIPLNSTLARPYDNLGIPGIPIASFLDSVTTPAAGFGPLVLRSSALGKSIFKQVQTLKKAGAAPDLVTFWLGANDVLGYATSGGTVKNPFNNTADPTPGDVFAFLYKQALDSLRSALPNAKIVVATIPNVGSVPFFTTVGPKMAAGIKAAKAVNSAIVGLFYQKHGEVVASSFTNFDNPANTPLITLKASTYAALLGDTTGRWYSDNGITTLPANINTKQPFGFHPQNPFPDALVLDSAEQAVAAKAVLDFNAAITASAAADGAALFDAYSFFSNVAKNGYSVAGEVYTAAYISGGLFSLDGVHPSSRGYAIIANQYINTMNAKFGMNVPLVSLANIPGIPTPLGKYVAGSHIVPTISPDAWKSFDALWGSGN